MPFVNSPPTTRKARARLVAYSLEICPEIFMEPVNLFDLATQQSRWLAVRQSAVAGNVANALLYNNDARSLIENAIGGSGGDTLVANQAANRLTGNGGADTFAWRSSGAAGTGSLADTITDFLRGTDRINRTRPASPSARKPS